jgi:hypothetical protein
MNQGADPAAGGALPSPYERLGISPDASFDAVQQAKRDRLSELGDDPQARARVEAAYDAVLMDRLKERQQGKVSSAALNASQREATRPALASPPVRPRPKFSVPSLELAMGRERWFPLGVGAVLVALLLLTPATSAELLLALATVMTAVNLQRRNGKFLSAVGWSFLLLSVGLVLGGLLVRAIDPSLPLGLPLAPSQVQSLPPLVLLILGALLLA